MIISALKINGMNHPMGYSFSNVTVSWRVEEAESAKQSETRILIAKDSDFLDTVSEKRGILPSSGVSMDITLEPRTTYYVKVIVRGEDGDEAEASESFDTGKMEEEWTGKWIGPEENADFHPVLSKSFELDSEIKRARLYVSGVGLFEASINGKKIGDDVLAPFLNDYRCGIQTVTYDVTSLIEAKNTLSILLGAGWYKGRLGYEGRSAVFGNRFAAICELHMEMSDGTVKIVSTDDTWTVTPSDIIYSDIYDGEGVDRTKYSVSRPEYNAECVDMSDKKLVDRFSMPLSVMEEVNVKEIITTPAGETVLDFGQNFAGFVSFDTTALESGDKVTLEHGEVLQGGNFYHDNYRSAKTLITYISDGRNEWYMPKFTYMGFRYVKVSGWRGEIKASDFVGKVVYSAMERTGYLETGHEKVNKLLSNALWGLKSNFLDMPTDCPQRDERLGWTGDAQVFAKTASFFMDTKSFYRKFFWDMRNDQKLHGGAIASYLPNFDNAPVGAAVWADAATIIPETVYDVFADIELLRETYPLMRDWVDYVDREDQKHGHRYLYNFAFTFGDWLAMDGVTEQSMKGGTEDAYVSCVYYYQSCEKVRKAAEILGYSDDEQKYKDLSEKIREAVLDEYFTPSGRIAIDTQAAYITALHFGIWRNRDTLISGLRTRLKKDGNRIRCGFVGAPLICETLADCGMMDLAMHLFLQEKFPSWLHCVDLGATTIWERWNSLLDDGSISGTGMNSLNHYSYGSVSSFVVRSVAGLKPLTPGYSKVRIAPVPDARLGKLNLTYISASGKYVADWKINSDGTISLHYEIPFDCEAEIVIPETGEIKNLTSGKYDFVLSPSRDYRNLYTYDTMLDEVTGDERAMKILAEELPAAFGMASSSDIEALSMTFTDLKYQPWFGCPAPMVEKAMARLSEIKAEV